MKTPNEMPGRPGLKPLSESRIERNGLKAGSVAPNFTLPDINGGSVTLDQYRGTRVLLIFSDPHCGPCNDLAPHLTRSHRRRRPDSPHIILVSRGVLEDVRSKAEEHDFEFPVVMQDGWKVSRKYGIFATPVAFMIGADGRTIGNVSIGFDQILAVLRAQFPRSAVEFSIETMNDVSRALESPIPRREAFRLAAGVVVGAVFTVFGLQNTAFAACASGFIACGTACCDSVTERCCNAALNLCCHLSLACCNGKCCAPTEVCIAGKCRQQIQS